jgi:RNA polymerase sigma-70 factor (ECF subfamily)
MMNQDERELIDQVRNGNSVAFDALVKPHWRRLFLMIRRVLRDDSEAEDVMQEALIRIFRALGGYRGDASFYTWMFRIAFNCAIDFAARKKKMMTIPLAVVEPDWEGSDGQSPENVIIGKQMAVAVSDVLERMHPECKEAILLHQVEGLSYGQISDMMECPVGTVRSRIFRARDLIASKLRQRGFTAR